jgi:hypothetical protein
VGRFISADSIVPSPSDPQDFNRYSYVGNNPLKYIDPTGHADWEGATFPPDFIETTYYLAPPSYIVFTPEQRAYIEEHCSTSLLPTITLPDAERWGIRIDFTAGVLINIDINIEITARSGHLLKDLKLTSTANVEIGVVGVGGSVGPVFLMQESEDSKWISLAPIEVGEVVELGPGLEFGQAFNRETGELEALYGGFGVGTSVGYGYSDVIGLTVDWGAMVDEISERLPW